MGIFHATVSRITTYVDSFEPKSGPGKMFSKIKISGFNSSSPSVLIHSLRCKDYIFFRKIMEDRKRPRLSGCGSPVFAAYSRTVNSSQCKSPQRELHLQLHTELNTEILINLGRLNSHLPNSINNFFLLMITTDLQTNDSFLMNTLNHCFVKSPLESFQRY